MSWLHTFIVVFIYCNLFVEEGHPTAPQTVGNPPQQNAQPPQPVPSALPAGSNIPPQAAPVGSDPSTNLHANVALNHLHPYARVVQSAENLKFIMRNNIRDLYIVYKVYDWVQESLQPTLRQRYPAEYEGMRRNFLNTLPYNIVNMYHALVKAVGHFMQDRIEVKNGWIRNANELHTHVGKRVLFTRSLLRKESEVNEDLNTKYNVLCTRVRYEDLNVAPKLTALLQTCNKDFSLSEDMKASIKSSYTPTPDPKTAKLPRQRGRKAPPTVQKPVELLFSDFKIYECDQAINSELVTTVYAAVTNVREKDLPEDHPRPPLRIVQSIIHSVTQDEFKRVEIGDLDHFNFVLFDLVYANYAVKVSPNPKFNDVVGVPGKPQKNTSGQAAATNPQTGVPANQPNPAYAQAPYPFPPGPGTGFTAPGYGHPGQFSGGF